MGEGDAAIPLYVGIEPRFDAPRGWYEPGTVRKLTARRVHPLMAMMTIVSATSSDSENSARASSRSSLGIPARSTDRSKRRAQFAREQARLFPRGEVAAFVELVVVDELRVCPLRPAPRCLVLLAGEHAHGHGNGDALGVEETALVLPVQTRRRDARVR